MQLDTENENAYRKRFKLNGSELDLERRSARGEELPGPGDVIFGRRQQGVALRASRCLASLPRRFNHELPLDDSFQPRVRFGLSRLAGTGGMRTWNGMTEPDL